MVPTQIPKFATWNVLSLTKLGSIENLIDQVRAYNVSILALQEIRFTGNGIIDLPGGYTLLYSGHANKREFGVGFLVSSRYRKFITDFKAVNDKICTMRFHGRLFNITFINVHAPTEEKSVEVKDNFYECLENVMNNIPQHDVKIALGDFNAKIGSSDGEFRGTIGPNSIHNESNDNGNRAIELALQFNLSVASTYFPHKRIHKATWRSNDGKTNNQIDHILISRRHFTDITDVKTARGADIDSDHFLVIAKYKYRLSDTFCRQYNKISHWNSHSLQFPEKRCSYAAAVSRALDDTPLTHNINDQWKDIKTAITDASNSVLGRKEPAQRNAWMDSECRAAIGVKEEMRRKNLERDTRLTRLNYINARKLASKTCRRKKRNFKEQQIQNIECATSLRERFKNIKDITKSHHPRSNAVRDDDGVLHLDAKEILTVWEDYFNKLLNPAPAVQLSSRSTQIECDINVTMTPPAPPTYNEVREVIGSLKNNKAPGEDGITNEMLKWGGDDLIFRIYELIVSIWEQEDIPDDWKTALICPLHKKGERTDCKNFRGICLLNTCYKVLALTVLQKLVPYSERILGEYQCGFRPNRSTNDQTFTLRLILEKCRENNITLHKLFIDFKQAYDSIIREEMWAALKRLGIPAKIISVCQSMLDGSLCKVLIEGQTSNSFEVTSGVRQGDPIAQVLFNLVLEYVMRVSGIAQRNCIYGKSTQTLVYADDICLIGRNIPSMKEVLIPLETNAHQVGLHINESKTKYMATSRRDSRNDFTCGETRYENVDTFKYLGSIISKDNNVSSDIKTRIAAGFRAFHANAKLLKSRQLSRRLKLQIYKTLVRPVITFGSECWTLTAADERRLAVCERKMIRSIYGGVRVNGNEYRSLMNTEIRDILAKVDIIGFIKSNRIRWLGHVLRSQNRAMKQVLETGPPSNRPRGRPRLRWLDDVEEDLNQINRRDWRTIVNNRKEWKKIVEAIKFLHGM